MLAGFTKLSDVNYGVMQACNGMAERSESVVSIAIHTNVCSSLRTLHAISNELASAEKEHRHLVAAMTSSVNRICNLSKGC